MKSANEVRTGLVDFFCKDIVGPAHGAHEELEEKPSIRYSAGVLFAPETAVDESSEIGGVSADPESQAGASDPAALDHDEHEAATKLKGDATGVDPEADDAITLANTYKPSAIGLSFVVDGKTTKVLISPRAAVYERTQKENRRSPVWRRRELPLSEESFALDRAGRFTVERTVFQGLRLRLVGRPRRDGTLLCTACLYNATSEQQEFFQVQLELKGDVKGAFSEYASADLGASDDEELALAMLYRERRVFAVGHGCAVDWSSSGPSASVLRTAIVPAVAIPPVLPTAGKHAWLNMQLLSGDGASDEEILGSLEEMVSDYRGWIVDREREALGLESAFAVPARKHLDNCAQAADRMANGVGELRANAFSLEAFKLMNRAMLRQQLHSKMSPRAWGSASPPELVYESVYSDDGVRGYWRRFQIAFVLMSLVGCTPTAPRAERELVDLIWFPTGGGKTEAYLGLAAFCLFRRRMSAPKDDGCAILMRYTLRLLTAQQFQRAAALICACESIRRGEIDSGNTRLGPKMFRIGLWAGKSLTPNRQTEARKAMNQLAQPDGEGKNPFQLLNCPWCAIELTNPKHLGYVTDASRTVRFRCPNSSCEFSTGARPLPVAVVDETLYGEPPSLLVGTVDKFALLAWRPEARCFFGGTGRLPPDLIIQDELHLISGPLGSMVGLYEGLIDRLCRSPSGVGPKIVASTATIRRASEQCRALYDRPMFQFPPQGLSASDSYFAEEDASAPGRLYLGLLPTAASSPLTAQVRAVASLLQGTLVAGGGAGDIDPYWTLVQYFSSLKELGRAATLVSGDIPEYLPAMYRRYAIPVPERRRIYNSEELTSRKREEEIPEILKKMGNKHDPSLKPFEQPPDTVLATNMISVGVDVDRLGLMMVVTQPKGTSEYIQASSRVGRSTAAPGLVLTLYNASRPRDRSHYEQFKPYHDAFYRYVEPTSVTPFSIPALARGLHGVIVATARQLAGFETPDKIGDPAKKGELDALMAELRQRVGRIDKDHVDAFDETLAQRTKEWASWNVDRWGDFGKSEDPALMYPPGSVPPEGYEESSWSTPSSLRNVDAECEGLVVNYVVED